MNEVEKMYENAGIVPDCEHGECGLDYCPNNYGCGYAFYPPFTAEKQLELIKWLINKGQLRITRFLYEYAFDFRDYDIYTDLYHVNVTLPSIEEGVSFIINNIWQDLTEEERKQIKEILSE